MQYGCTSYAKVNRTVHAYVRSKTKYVSAAKDLLDLFVRIWAARDEPHDHRRLSPPTFDLATVLPKNWQRASGVCHHVDVRTGVEHFESTMEPFTFFMCGDTSRCGLWRAYLHDDDRRWWANESLLLFFFEQDAMLLEDF